MQQYINLIDVHFDGDAQHVSLFLFLFQPTIATIEIEMIKSIFID